MKIKKAAVALVAAAALLTGLVAVQPAAAASNGVYIVTPKSWGWCPNIRGIPNKVVYVSVTNTTTGHSQTDRGDDIGWVRVKLHQRNRVHVNVGCSAGYGSGGTVVTITPRRHKQSWFVGPTGVTWGN